MNLNETVKNCGKCALCLSVCPVYKVERSEMASPRAKVQLTKAYLNKEFESSKYFQEIFSKCLLCENCKTICPGALKLDELFLNMRSKFVKKYGLKLNKKISSKIFSDKKKISFISDIMRLGHKKIPFLNFRIGALDTKNIPKFSKRTLKSQFPEIVKSKGKKGTVLFFTGCIDNYFYDEVGKSAINILTKLGYDVILSKDEVCCGIPMIVAGDFEGAVKNIKTNLKVFDKDVDAIIVTCATCGTALKKLYAVVLAEMGLEKESKSAKKISAKVKDINEFISNKLSLCDNGDCPSFLKKKGTVPIITYHDPCHLLHGQNIKEEPRNILKNIPGIEFVEMDEMGCCGAGGLFQVNYPDISKKIGEDKLKNIKKTKADIIVTSCPSCKIQLINLVKSANLNMQVMHIIELLDSNSI